MEQQDHDRTRPSRCPVHHGSQNREPRHRPGDHKIDDDEWVPIGYTCDGYAEVADCFYTTGKGTKAVTRRLVVRRTMLADTEQQKLFPGWRHHAFLTDLTGPTVEVDAFHRQHAVVELAIKDLKAGAGLEHLPSGKFWANSAWFRIAILAHNMIRWTAHLGGQHKPSVINPSGATAAGPLLGSSWSRDSSTPIASRRSHM